MPHDFQLDEYDAFERRVLEAMGGRSEFETLALDVFRFQRRHNPHYGRWCAHLGVDEGIDDWRDIPAVPQSAFKRYALRSFPPELTTKTFRTSGTTGEGYGEHHFLETNLYDAAIMAGWDSLKLQNLPLVILTPSPQDAPHSSLSHMMGVLATRAPRHVFCMENPGIHLATKEPIGVLGTALAFLHFFERGGHERLPAGSFVIETGGYKGSGRVLAKPELYGLFEKRLGIAQEEIINEYGMTELSSQFYARGLRTPHRAPPWMRALVIDPATGMEVAPGETGVLKLHDLANLGSVAAIQTQDLAIRREDGFELLGRDPAALPRGCSRSAYEFLTQR